MLGFSYQSLLIWNLHHNYDLYSLGDISWERNMQYIPRGGFAPKRDILYQYIEGLPEVYWWNIQRESKLDRSKSDKSSEIRRIKDDLSDLDLSSWDSSWIFPIFLEHWNVTLWILRWAELLKLLKNNLFRVRLYQKYFADSKNILHLYVRWSWTSWIGSEVWVKVRRLTCVCRYWLAELWVTWSVGAA